MTVTRIKPRLRVVEPEPAVQKPKRKRKAKPKPEPFNDYRDSAAYKRTQRLRVEPHTPKRSGDFILTSRGVEVQP